MSETSEQLDDISTALDEIEDALDIIEGVSASWLKATLAKKSVQLSLTGALALAVGGAVGYFVASKRLAPKYQKIADEQVAEVKSHYALLNKTGEYSDLEALAAKHKSPAEIAEEKALDIIGDQGYLPYNEVEPKAGETVDTPQPDEPQDANVDEADDDPPEPDEPVVHLFSSDLPDSYWDWEEEKQRRVEHWNEPYVITLDEFNLNEEDYNQLTLTYFEEDEVLVDDKDQPIPDEERVVGMANLTRFGHASNDPNVVYVCNNRLQAYFEIIRSEASYAQEVLGMRHSDSDDRIRKFRNHD